MNMEYWKQFESSGKIEDYLSFVSCERREQDQGEQKLKEGSDAGIYFGDRDRAEAVSCGGVRQEHQYLD
ncbi:MAG: hypothetical protein K2O06_11865 [Acetatifactor sp.]|nr:hypothetical protein [Acetatifactor sp.]